MGFIGGGGGWVVVGRGGWKSCWVNFVMSWSIGLVFGFSVAGFGLVLSGGLVGFSASVGLSL